MFSPATYTTEAIDGYLRIFPHLARLDGYPDHKVVVLQQQQRNEHQQPQIALISGGGDGHAPDSIGFIGSGMLTAAVSGHLFASPSTESVCHAINYITDNNTNNIPNPSPDSLTAAAAASDVLLIIKNYTGDRLNFGLALELSRSRAYDDHSPPNIDLVVVGDDVAIPRGQSIAGRRGIAGTILVIKIAGAAARDGKDLKETTEIARSTASRLVSLSAVFQSCHIPGEEASSSDGMDKDHIALGFGIHNEQGMSRVKLAPIDQIIHHMLNLIMSKAADRDFFWKEASEMDNNSNDKDKDVDLQQLPSVIVLVNNLGTMIDNELHIICGYVLDDLHERGIEVLRVLCGKFMTGLDQRGFSLTLLRLPVKEQDTYQILKYLDADTSAPAWPNAPVRLRPRMKPILVGKADSTVSSSSIKSSIPSPLARKILSNIAQSLLSSVDELNRLDSQAGDGDCGNTFKSGAAALYQDLQSATISSASSASSTSSTSRSASSFLASSMFDSLRFYTTAMGGTSGAIYSILLTAAASHAKEAEHGADPQQPPLNDSVVALARLIAESLTAAVTILQRYSGAQLNDRTLLDALCPALKTLLAALPHDAGSDAIMPALQASLKSAESGLAATQHMTARAGRASYVPSSVSQQSVDPGARAIVIMLTTIVQTWQATDDNILIAR